MTLLALLYRHRPAIEYDLTFRFGFGADAVLTGVISWNRMVMLVAGIMHDVYSHSHAAVMGWAYAPNPSDVLFANWVDATAQMHHQRGKVPPTPIKRPWEESRRDRPSAVLSADQRQRRDKLRDRLGLTM